MQFSVWGSTDSGVLEAGKSERLVGKYFLILLPTPTRQNKHETGWQLNGQIFPFPFPQKNI